MGTHKNTLKVNDIDPEKYKAERISQPGFKKYSPGESFEDEVKPNEGAICSQFGCKMKLSLRQQMAGNRCEDHPKEERSYSHPLL